ncbi:hypothetical protein BDQ17DRAFT_1347917 [Cyathus striatus]|nr:hypothetical protein BDQ17DRAFT_1347917 [Cyathus striatus]
MLKGVQISTSLCQTVVRMSSCFSSKTIHAFTTVSEQSQQRIIHPWKETGDDVYFIQGVINHSCDVYLDELQEVLGIICGANVSKPTIWCTLKCDGYHMMKLNCNAAEHSSCKHARFIVKVATQYKSEQLVFVDESAADCILYYWPSALVGFLQWILLKGHSIPLSSDSL